jgi:hypothetical protein
MVPEQISNEECELCRLERLADEPGISREERVKRQRAIVDFVESTPETDGTSVESSKGREVPEWSSRLHRFFRILSTAGASRIIKE